MQSSAGLGLQIGFWCNPRRVWGFKSVFDAILGGFGTQKAFLVRGDPHFTPQQGTTNNEQLND
jgi:hypothetical protein